VRGVRAGVQPLLTRELLFSQGEAGLLSARQTTAAFILRLEANNSKVRTFSPKQGGVRSSPRTMRRLGEAKSTAHSAHLVRRGVGLCPRNSRSVRVPQGNGIASCLKAHTLRSQQPKQPSFDAQLHS
jgi:hypothetical protein